jgi:hypothetical protein
MTNLYRPKYLDSFDPAMKAGQYRRRLSSMCRHDNRLLRYTVVKYSDNITYIYRKGLGALDQIPGIGLNIKIFAKNVGKM